MYSIRLATPADLPAIGPIEAAAEQLFHAAGIPIGTTAAGAGDEAEYATACREGRLFVAELEGRCVGFLLLDSLDDGDPYIDPHIEEMDVHPDQQQKGIGTALIRHALDACRARGARRATLSTFREPPWNAPFYRRLGFRELPEAEWTPGLRALRAWEEANGLDLAGRCLMEIDLQDGAQGSARQS